MKQVFDVDVLADGHFMRSQKSLQRKKRENARNFRSNIERAKKGDDMAQPGGSVRSTLISEETKRFGIYRNLHQEKVSLYRT